MSDPIAIAPDNSTITLSISQCAAGWDRLVVAGTNLWGDAGNRYLTLGSGAAGIMFNNPHVTWYGQEGRASIRYGRVRRRRCGRI